jgi:hypothetical protein
MFQDLYQLKYAKYLHYSLDNVIKFLKAAKAIEGKDYVELKVVNCP